MSCIYYSRRFCLIAAAACLLMAGTSLLRAQTRQLLAWQEDLASLKNATGDDLVEQRVAVVQIRNAVEFWLKFHPSSKAALPSAPQQPWGAEAIRNQVSVLSQVLETILKADPGQPFNLGDGQHAL